MAWSIGCAYAENPASHAHWSYQGSTDPAHWADLDKANAACRLSQEQSPINIDVRAAKKAPLAALEFSYAAGTAEVINNGHTVQVNPAAGNTLKVGEDVGHLLQFHFHTPSEESVNGVRYPLVAHFVHKGFDGKLSVVALLFKEGRRNQALAPMFTALPTEGKLLALANMNPGELLPADHSYFKFMGSLTTPPCSDGVRWQVLKQTAEISKQQLSAFRKLYTMNARPIQPLNSRVVEVSD
ncbi:carbonate dehydratase [Duganella sp. FT94W]|uniref:carbonic anhydrase n=2 Tax=Duganella lactea TaxID=2692173 RepID=A0ABW9V5U7_9BURK|nr:carbonate dehydratase [Duganella lactea]